MSQIHNSELTKELIDGARIQTSREMAPNLLAEKVVPVMEVNPKLLKEIDYVKSDSAINSVGGTIYTTPSDQDFYLCGCSLSVIKDATATSTGTTISITPYTMNATAVILSIPSLTLTAQQFASQIDFNRPIRIKRGTTIVLANTTAVGNITARACIYGYHIRNPNA